MILAGLRIALALAALWAAVTLAAVAAGWLLARWQHRSTHLSARLFYAAAAAALAGWVVAVLLGTLLGAAWLNLLLLPFLALTGTAGLWGHRHHRRALGAGGELRDWEMSREHSIEAWRAAIDSARRRAPEAGESRTRIINQGELLTERPITFRTVELDEGGRLRAAAEQGRHILAAGTTGSGKTRTIERIIAVRSTRDDAGLVVVDPKPDRELEEHLRALAGATGRPFYLIDPDHPDGVRWNPLADKDPSMAAEVAAAAMQMDEPYYETATMLHLNKVARAVHARHGTVNLRSLAAAAALTAAPIVRQWAAADERTGADIAAYYDEVAAGGKDREKAIAGAVLRIQSIAQRRWADVFAGDGDALSLVRAMRERAIVLVRPVEGRGKREAEAVSGLLLADLAAACTQLDQRTDHWVAFIDEFGAVAGGPNLQHLIGLFQRARSAGGQLIVATQSVADLRALTEGEDAAADSLAENIGTLIAHQQRTTVSREWLSMFFGTREVWAMTERIDNHGVSPVGEGSARRAREFLVGPDQFTGLGVGEAIVYTLPAPPARGQVELLPEPPLDVPAPPPGGALTDAGPSGLSAPEPQTALELPDVARDETDCDGFASELL